MPIPKILQMPDGRNCGQVALANLTGQDLKLIERMVGHKGGTKTRVLAGVLWKLGYGCGDKLIPIHPTQPGYLATGEPVPEFGIAKLGRENEFHPGRTSKGKWHWVAVVDGEILDGQNPNLNWGYGWKITSYLPVSLCS